MGRIVNSFEVVERVKSLRLENPDVRVVTTNGCFDLLHSAHVDHFEMSKREGDVLIVLVDCDENIRLNKGVLRPIMSESERARIISAFEAVDYVVITEVGGLLPLLTQIKSDVHTRGGSFDPEKLVVEKKLFASWGAEYVMYNLKKGISTTSIIRKIIDTHK